MKEQKKLGYKKLRKIHYLNQFKKGRLLGADMTKFYNSPYTYLKARYYVETSVLIVYFSQFTKITPNFLTFIYIILGIISGPFLASGNSLLILIALIILFTKGSFDWADGLLARIQNKSSELGNVLDNWGSLVGTYSYLFGFGMYLYNSSNNNIFLILSILIIIVKAIDMRVYSHSLAIYEYLKFNKKIFFINIGKLKNKQFLFGNKKSLKYKAKMLIQSLFDERSRSIDLIVLLIFIDNYFYNLKVLEYIYFFIAAKSIIVFAAGIKITFNTFLK